MIVKVKNREYTVHAFIIFIIVITILKLFFMALFSSEYQNEMFMPFVDRFVSNIGVKNFNVYDYYVDNDLRSSFPYPPLMLYIESIGGGILHIMGENNVFLRNIIFKLPIMAFDFIGMYYLMKIFPNKRKYVGVLYFASPIVIYAGYMHGQLDIIPTTFLIISIYYITRKQKSQYTFSALALAGALTCKLHILAVLPIIFIYTYKKAGIKVALKHITLTSIVTLMIMLPFIGIGFVESVIFNNEQTLLTQVYFEFVNVKIYTPILVILLIYIKAFDLNGINKELFLGFCGVLFATFLSLVPPMPGWYIWIVPFITMFFINVKENRYRNGLIYLLLNGLYVIYFLFFHSTGKVDLYLVNKSLQFIKIDNDFAINFTFTLLTGILICTVYLIYQFGIASNSFYKRKNLPVTIGIAGDSASGKSTFIEVVENCLGTQNLLFIEGDGDHKWERGEKMWEEFTHLNPKANYLYRQAKDIQTLRMGASVMRVEYNHDTGKFSHNHKIKPKKYIMMCGLHSLYLPQMRKSLDLKIFMDADEKLRRFWKIQRDTKNRGYTKEKIIEQIEDRMADAQRYIYPQKEYADLIIQYFDKNLTDYFADDYTITMSLKLTLSAEINLEPLEKELIIYGIEMSYDYKEDLEKQTVIFDGTYLKEVKIPFESIANRIIPQLDELTNQNLDDTDNINGILKLVLLELISYKMQGDK